MARATTVDMADGRVVGVQKAASEIGIHRNSLYRWIRDKKVVFITFGDIIFIPVMEVERLKLERDAGATTASLQRRRAVAEEPHSVSL